MEITFNTPALLFPAISLLLWTVLNKYVFALSLLSLLASLIISLIEISRSTQALELELSDMEDLEKTNFFTDIWKTKGGTPKEE